VGTSGWNYRDWGNGVFYPPGFKGADWLRFYAEQFGTVEVNNTFYRLPERRVFKRWSEQTPVDFKFSVKAGRFITHMKKLAQPAEHVGRLLRRAAALGSKLGVLLFQLPPSWQFDPQRLERFGAFLRRQKIVSPLRAALEVRHQSWLCEECFSTLRRHRIALVLDDWPGLNVCGPITADFVFVRRHGPGKLYASGYPDSALRADARQIRAWLREGLDVHVYFNNDAHAHAVHDASKLKKFLA
jgi:uncharacterized protein YecE (DUF72 family)